ncbi:hypothetical protein BJX68DRAFT_233037 [Aspergillus pseudodeflectus]|uniref:DUF7580 domain-containing protein n=1 Tax=Aspergillus pseudodeflectus TaxID=176178 RepID=A0ABR4KPK0_9EURO
MSGIEIAGFAWGVAVAVESLIETLVEGIKHTTQFGSGIERARLALSLEATSFRSIKRVLFGTADSPTPGHLFSLSDLQTQIDLLNVLRLLNETLESKYCLVTSKYNASRPSLLTVFDNSIAFGSYHNVSLVRKLRWGFSEKAKTEGAVQELRIWNERLLRIIQSQMVDQQLSGQIHANSGRRTSHYLQILQQTEDAATLGLITDMRLLNLSLSDTPGVAMVDLEQRDKKRYNTAQLISTSENRRLVRIANSYILIEHKPFFSDQEGRPSQVSWERANQLANILHEDKPERYCSLPCLEFFVEDGQFAFCFNIPSQHEYRTLSQLLSQSKVPALESRFILARELSAALSQFHTVKWIHKSFRSNNILFFQDTQSKDTTPSFHRPYLFGWEYARPESGFSSRVDEKDDIEENVYRHPEQWGLPTSSFNRLHDIYSLGVVLLEIGLWKPVISLHRWGFKNVGLGSEVKDYLIESARHQRLRAAMGERYQNLVLSCLQGSFEFCDPTMGTVAVETFKKEVCDRASKSKPAKLMSDLR